jgi:protein-S-isoprenylcysteine O-methyltransferase Ste14
MDSINTFILLIAQIMVTTHFYLFGFEPNKLNKGLGDKIFDPLYTSKKYLLSFVLSIITMMFYLFSLLLNLYSIKLNNNFLYSILHFGSIEFNYKLALIGFLFFLIGTIIRVLSVRHLKSFFTFQIGIRQEHKLITTGPYKYVRHPSYSSYFFLILGISIYFHNLTYCFISIIPMSIFFMFRIHGEEEMLINHFGNKYLHYSKKTKRFIPFVI